MANRKQDKQLETERRQRLNEVRRRQQKVERRRAAVRNSVVGVAGLAVVGGVILLVVQRAGNKTTAPTIAGVQSFGNLSQEHVSGPVTYAQTPPVGGKHSSTWLNCGIYTSPVPNENAAHDLEHGAVWITYKTDLPAADVQTLTALVRGQTFLVLSPYVGLSAPVVASAWGKQLQLQSVRDPRLREFIDTYRNGPQNPEKGAQCQTGGTGSPVG